MKTFFTLTMDRLDKLGPCSAGRADVEKFLPTKIYTTAKKNEPLARRLRRARIDESCHVGMRVGWLAYVLGVGENKYLYEGPKTVRKVANTLAAIGKHGVSKGWK